LLDESKALGDLSRQPEAVLVHAATFLGLPSLLGLSTLNRAANSLLSSKRCVTRCTHIISATVGKFTPFPAGHSFPWARYAKQLASIPASAAATVFLAAVKRTGDPSWARRLAYDLWM
jgi:hypothetical protein